MVTSLNTAAASGGPATLTFNTTTITVNPGAYTGQWWLYHAASSATGARSLELVPGVNYQALVGVAGAFNFSVAADGMVTSLNTAAASGGPATLTFNTTTITVNPGAYTGQWWLYHATSSATGARSLELVPGVNYQALVGVAGAFNFSVAADGMVTSLNTAAASGGPATLTFNTTTITVNPGAYTGQWWLYHAASSATGARSLELVPGVNYQALVGVAGAFNFSVAADGMVTSLNTAAASGGPATLTFNTTTITVNPGTYTGQWGLYYAAPSAAGVRTLALVPGFPGITYVLQVPGQP